VPLLEAATVAGLKLHDIPVAKPLVHDRLTELENPPRELTIMVEVAEFPATMVAGENGVADIWKSLPVPNTGINWLPDALSLTERFAVRNPPPAGVKVGPHQAPA
jgi:hypothetical protein